MELVTGATGSLLLKLGELVKQEYDLQKGVKKKIQKLTHELEAAHTLLCKIGEVPADQLDKQVKLWASEVREASYDMEDIVDTFLVRVQDPDEPTEQNKLRRLRKKVGRLFKKSKARHNISSLIDELNEKLVEVAARRDRYKLDNIGANHVAANNIDPRILNLRKKVMDLVGIEGPRDELINKLSLGDGDVDLSSTTKMKILSIVGFGGLGKTTLAKAVYDHLKPRFKCSAFVTVGQNPDIKKVFRDILRGLDKETYTHSKLKDLEDEEQLMDEINEFVKEKRCLIVIDDIWDMKICKLVRCALQESNCESRLVITTRNSEVATYAGEAYKMQPLSHDNSKELLYARIADNQGKYFDSPSAEACEKILKKCGGVPLAIITIASLLASKPGEDWSMVYNSIGFGPKGNDDVANTRKILSFSYYDLPSHLKSCLLYLSVFPEDHVIEKNSLIWMWMAEGFISQEQATAEEVGLFELGERFFNELINRSMILPRETWYENRGYIDACSVHDMVLDLIHQLSSDENFVTVLNGGGQQKLHDMGRISRRLALQCVEEHGIGHHANISVKKVRSIFTGQCDFCALCIPFLRVADIEQCSVCKDHGKVMLDHLGSLHHLRYLRVGRNFATVLPREVRYMRFLQTLDIRNNRLEELPEEVGLLTQLVCLRLGGKAKVPAGLIGKLTSLQELCVWCSKDGTMQFAKDLGLLKELRVLKVETEINAWPSESIESLLESLGYLHYIKELQFYSSLHSDSNKVNCDAGWFSCQHLCFLDFNRILVFYKLSAWINSSLAPNLSYLSVRVVVVNDQDMENLSKLPQLICLKLYSKGSTKSVVSIKISTDEGGGYFHKLRFLTIYGASIWFDLHGSECNNSRVPSSNSIMPSLESLSFEVQVRSLKDKNLHLGFDKMLGFQNLATSSLHIVDVQLTCEGAGPREVEEAEAALEHAAAIHPKHPTLHIGTYKEDYMISHYEETQ